MKVESKVESILAADKNILFNFGVECYSAGFKDGINICDKIVGWLTMQPDTKRQKDQRAWVKNLILKECESVGIDPPEWIKDWDDSKEK